MNASVQTAPIGAPTVSTLLRRCWPRHAAKHAARAAATSPDTARAWVAGLKSPSACTLLRMARHNDQLRAELVRLLTEECTHGGMAQRADDAGPARGAAPGDLVGARGPLVRGAPLT